MAVSKYRDLLTVGTQLDRTTGLLLSDTISNLARRWGSNDAVNGAIAAIASINTDFGPATASKVARVPDTFGEASEPCQFPSTQCAYITGIANYQPYLGAYMRTDWTTGKTTTLTASNWVNIGLQARFVLSGLDRSRFIAVPYVNARDINGNLCGNKTLKDYKQNYASVYPYIVSVTYGTYYKANLESASYSSASIGLIGNATYVINHIDNFGANGAVRYKCQGWYTRVIDSTSLIRFPNLTYGNIDNTKYSVRVKDLTTANSSTYRYIRFMNGEYPTRPPFLYTTVADVEDAINRLGLWWAEDLQGVADAHGMNTISEDVHAPQIDNNGYVSDDWFSGNTDPEQNGIYINFSKGGDYSGMYNPLGDYDITGNNTVGDNYPLTPTRPIQTPDPLRPDDTSLALQDTDYNGVGLFGTYWCGSRQSIQAFNDKLWNNSEPNFILTLLEGLKLYGSDPVNAVMSLRLYPFNVGAFANTDGYHNVKLGTTDMGFKMLKLSDAASIKFSLGSFLIEPKFNNFLDLAPYTAITLFIPFVGSMQINVNDFLGKTLSVDMTVDLTTGQCMACVYADNVPMMHSGGQMGVEIPISAKTFADTAMSLVEATASLAVGAATNLIGVASGVNFKNFDFAGTTLDDGSEGLSEFENAYTGGETKLLTGAGQTITHSIGELFFGGTSIDRTGCASPANGMTMPVNCFLVISRPTVETPDDYNHTYGKVCHTSDTLNNFSGFTVCSNVDTSGISATEQERSAIKAFLESGVYV